MKKMYNDMNPFLLLIKNFQKCAISSRDFVPPKDQISSRLYSWPELKKIHLHSVKNASCANNWNYLPTHFFAAVSHFVRGLLFRHIVFALHITDPLQSLHVLHWSSAVHTPAAKTKGENNKMRNKTRLKMWANFYPY